MNSCELREEVSLEQDAPFNPEIMPLDRSTPHEFTPPGDEPARTPADIFSPRETTAQAEPARGAKGKQGHSQDIAAPPCFFSSLCQQRASLEKAGRSVCRGCAESRLRGSEYPLRASGTEPLYFTGREASEALDMTEDISHRARRRLRGGIWS